MTENANPQPVGEEPDSTEKREAQLSDVDELPTVAEEATQITPVAEPSSVPDTPSIADAATQITPAAETPIVPDMPSVADAATQILPVSVSSSALDTPPVAPAEVIPIPSLDQRGEPTGAVQPTSFADATQPAQIQFGEPTTDITAPPLTQPDQLPDAYAHLQYVPQPGQALPPYPGTPVSPTKKRRLFLWVTAAIIALLLVGGGTAVAIVQNQQPLNTPTQVLQQFCHGFTTFDAQEVYNTYTAELQQSASETQLQQSFKMLKGFGDMMTFRCTVDTVQQTSSTTAQAQLKMVYKISIMGVSASGSTPISLSLILENRLWKIDASNSGTPNFQMPTMTAFPTFPPGFLTPTTTPDN